MNSTEIAWEHPGMGNAGNARFESDGKSRVGIYMIKIIDFG